MTDTPERKLPSSLFHYTDAQGLLGILDHEAPVMRASSATYLNDSRELLFGADSIRKRMDKRVARSRTFDGKFEQWILAIADQIDLELRATKVSESEPFVACFSTADDALSQWQGYGGHGGGYCLEFDYDILNSVGTCYPSTDLDLPRPPSLTTRLVPVRYGGVEGTPDPIDDVVDELFAAYNHNSQIAQLDQIDLFELVQRTVLPILPLFKDPAFALEDEWRMVIESSHSEVKHRAGTRSIIPYVDLQLPKMALRKVWIGPGIHTEMRRSAVFSLLIRRGYSAIPVPRSSIPWRP
jgi:Protein of unknown function (DUF2971)